MAINVSELNTGKLTFEGAKIKGALGGLGSDTIELVPDVDLYASDQYLIIDPTAPDHVHIRAGGDIDNSDATLILGGEKSNISIDDQADAHVSILSKTADNSTSHVWQFNNNGSTNFPTITTNLLGVSTSVEGLMFGDNTLKSVITGPVPAATTAVKAIIVQGQDQTDAAGGDVCLYGGNSNRNAGDINITAGTTTGATYAAGTVTLQAGSNTAGTGGNVNISGGTGSGTSTHGEVTISSNSKTWTFNNDSNLTIPAQGDIRDPDGNTVVSGGNRVKNYSSSSGPTIPVGTDNIYSINTTSGSTNLTLPIGSTVPIGYELTVLDVNGNAASKNITVTAGMGDSIVSAPSGITIDTNFGLLAFKFIGGKDWIILYGR